MGRCIVVMKLICLLGHCECGGHTVHKLSQRRLTADWLAPPDSDCSRIHSTVSSDWLPSYIKATRPVLEVFKMTIYFPGSPRKGITCQVGSLHPVSLSKFSFLFYCCFKTRNVCDLCFSINTIMCIVCIFVFFPCNILAICCVCCGHQLQFGRVLCCKT